MGTIHFLAAVSCYTGSCHFTKPYPKCHFVKPYPKTAAKGGKGKAKQLPPLRPEFSKKRHSDPGVTLYRSLGDQELVGLFRPAYLLQQPYVDAWFSPPWLHTFDTLENSSWDIHNCKGQMWVWGQFPNCSAGSSIEGQSRG